MEKAQEQLLESMPDGVVVADRTGRIEFVTRQALRMSGYKRDELIGRNIEILVPTRKRSGHKANRDRYIAGAAPRAMGTGLDISMRRKDGTEFPADIALSPLKTPEGLKIIAAVRDVTERKRSQDRLGSILEVSQAALQGQSPDQVMAHVVRTARRLVGAAQGMALVRRVKDGALTVAFAEGVRVARLRGRTYPSATSLAGEALGTKQPIVVANASTEPRANKPLALAAKAGPSLVVPVEAGGHSFGAIALMNPVGSPPFTPDDATTIGFFAAQAAAALEYARLRGELSRLAVIDDRERIARELHDGAIQSLFAVGMGLQSLAARVGDAELSARIENSVVQIDRVIRDLRNYIFGLRPGILADTQLHQALTKVAQEFQKRTSLTTIIDIDPHVAARLTSHASELVQLTSEALSNVARHAQATTCRVSLHMNHRNAVLEIDDDGKGFDRARIHDGPGQGMRNLRERAEKVGGRLAIESRAGRGTSVRVTIGL